MEFVKYSGAGNTFLILDVRGKSFDISSDFIKDNCSKYGVDGMMLLDNCPGYDFRMEFFNPDGSGGMMCGNGGRCIVAFAKQLGIIDKQARFLAPDGEHTAQVISAKKIESQYELLTVRLKMVEPSQITEYPDGFFINTGTRHFVVFSQDVEDIDIETQGKKIRWAQEFAPQGTNVNFVQILQDESIKVRTFEKGVEGETLACGTGITASALVYIAKKGANTPVKVHARIADLEVESLPEGVFLTGPAQRIEL